MRSGLPPNPTGEAHSAPQTPWLVGRGLSPPQEPHRRPRPSPSTFGSSILAPSMINPGHAPGTVYSVLRDMCSISSVLTTECHGDGTGMSCFALGLVIVGRISLQFIRMRLREDTYYCISYFICFTSVGWIFVCRAYE